MWKFAAIVIGSTVIAGAACAESVECGFADQNGGFLFRASFDRDGSGPLGNLYGHIGSPMIVVTAKPPVAYVEMGNIASRTFEQDVIRLDLTLPASGNIVSDVKLSLVAQRVAAVAPDYSGDYELTIAPAFGKPRGVYSGKVACSVR